LKLSCLQENLNWALGIVRTALPARVVRPITANILVQALPLKLVLTATDLEVATTVSIMAKVDETGELIVPANKLIECISALPQDRVDISTKDTKSLYVKCGGSNSRLAALGSEDYPIIPEVEGESTEIVAGDLLKIISHTLFSVANDISRPIFTGINVQSSSGVLKFASADGFRISIYSYPSNSEDINIIIPSKSISALKGMLSDPLEMISVTIDQKRILFKSRSVQLISQLLVGKFPEYMGLLPKSFGTQVTVPGMELLRAINSATVFEREGSIKVSITKNKVTVSSRDDELGDNTTDIEAIVTGEDVKFAIKSKFMTEVLTVLKEGKVVLELVSSSNPIVVKNPADMNFVYVVMPMIVQW
jgi:DNA polymerase-3 subunit beta